MNTVVKNCFVVNKKTILKQWESHTTLIFMTQIIKFISNDIVNSRQSGRRMKSTKRKTSHNLINLIKFSIFV